MPSFRHGRIVIQLGDLASLSVDALVNPARPDLAPPPNPRERGVNAAIHAAAGPELAAATLALGGCAPGEAKVTPAFQLTADWIVHTVGPAWQGGTQNEDRVLEACYEKSLAAAFGAGATTIALPALATGHGGFPKERAAQIAISTTLDFLENHPSLEQVIFCCFGPADLDVYLSVADEYL